MMAAPERVFLPPGPVLLGIAQQDRQYVSEHESLIAPSKHTECNAFSCDVLPVSLGRFLDWFESVSNGFRHAARDNDKRFWGNCAMKVEDAYAVPVTEVTFEEAISFAWAHGGRLPFEAEWLRMARGDDESPTASLFPLSWEKCVSGDGATGSDEVSWAGMHGVVGGIDEMTLTVFSRQFLLHSRDDNYAMLGRDIIVTETGAQHRHPVLGCRGVHRPYYLLGDEFDVTARSKGLGFRVAYDWDIEPSEL